MGLINQSLNTAISRHLTIDLRQSDYLKANTTFNTAFFGISGIIFLFIPFFILFSFMIPSFFTVPEEQITQIILLFLGISFAFLIKSWSSNFMVTIFAHNRLDLQNFINIFNICFQVILIIVFFNLFSPLLSYIGLAYLISAVVSTGMTIYFSKKINPYLKVDLKYFKWSRLKNLTDMSWWVLINNLGALLFLQIDLIVVNKLFGLTSGGEYAIVLMWSTFFRGMAATLSGVLMPVILAYFAYEKIDKIIILSSSAVKLMCLFIAFPIAIACGFAPDLLTIWVGSQFSFLAPLMIIILCHLVINLSVVPLFAINVAFNKVRIPGLVTVIMGFMNLCFAIVIPIITGIGYYGVALAGGIILTLKNTIFTPWYTAKVLKIDTKTFLKSMIPGSLSAIVLFSCFGTIEFFTNQLHLIEILFIVVIVGICYFFVSWNYFLKPFERKITISLLPSETKKILERIIK